MNNPIWTEISRVAKGVFVLAASTLLAATIVAYILVPITVNDDELKRLTVDNDIVSTMTIRGWYAIGKVVGFDLLEVNDKKISIDDTISI